MTTDAPSQERVAVVDPSNRFACAAPRWRMRRDNLIHRACYILVFNSRGELFVHQRTDTKDVYPGFFDLAAGGVVLAGESYDAAAQRELAEELGIADQPLTALFDFFWEDAHCRVWGRVYRCVHDGPMRLQPEEIVSGRFMPPEIVEHDLPADRITPDSLEALRRYLEGEKESAPDGSLRRT
jgi:8-oxo-dGTP pyrophosphatase MutT (NUDIX family)